MFGLIGYGPGSGAGYIEWFGLVWFALLYAMCSLACVSRNVISLVAITRICVRSPDCRLSELCPPFLHFSFWAEKISSFLQLQSIMVQTRREYSWVCCTSVILETIRVLRALS